ncbi:MAG: MaoC family dehydratase [Gammaproteobacteria bacterium]
MATTVNDSPTSQLANALKFLQSRVGEEVHTSDWLTIDQTIINDFANATRDRQWIHVDEARAAKDSPYGRTIAHGFLTLSLYPVLRGLVDSGKPLAPGVKQVINYGINKLRFPNAVMVGSRIRAHCKIVSAKEVKETIELIEEYSVEIEGKDRPACVAECVMRLYF